MMVAFASRICHQLEGTECQVSTFNADQFLSTSVRAKLDTKFPSCPMGEYRALVEDLKVRTDAGKEKNQTILDVIWEVQDERVKELTGLKKVTVRQSIFLDITPEGQLDYGKGKNVSLGKLREALGQNDHTRDWYPNMLKGAIAKIVVEHKPNDNDPESPYANVTRVAAL